MKNNNNIKQFIGALVFFSILFVSAGSLNYFPGIAYVIIGLAMMLLNFTILKIDSELLKERSNPGKDAKEWDKAILGLSFLSTVAMYIVAGLDSGRFHWSKELPLYFFYVGVFFTIAGQFLFLLAQKQNKFFSSTVRIQKERNHIVCDKGLYKIVRHPAYMGSLIQLIGFPLLFGSIWSMIPVVFSAFLLIIRTYLEDRTLKYELNGYIEYSKKTKYRLIPFVW